MTTSICHLPIELPFAWGTAGWPRHATSHRILDIAPLRSLRNTSSSHTGYGLIPRPLGDFNILCACLPYQSEQRSFTTLFKHHARLSPSRPCNLRQSTVPNHSSDLEQTTSETTTRSRTCETREERHILGTIDLTRSRSLRSFSTRLAAYSPTQSHEQYYTPQPSTTTFTNASYHRNCGAYRLPRSRFCICQQYDDHRVLDQHNHKDTRAGQCDNNCTYADHCQLDIYYSQRDSDLYITILIACKRYAIYSRQLHRQRSYFRAQQPYHRRPCRRSSPRLQLDIGAAHQLARLASRAVFHSLAQSLIELVYDCNLFNLPPALAAEALDLFRC